MNTFDYFKTYGAIKMGEGHKSVRRRPMPPEFQRPVTVTVNGRKVTMSAIQYKKWRKKTKTSLRTDRIQTEPKH